MRWCGHIINADIPSLRGLFLSLVTQPNMLMTFLLTKLLDFKQMPLSVASAGSGNVGLDV